MDMQYVNMSPAWRKIRGIENVLFFGAASLHINKINETVGLLLKRVFIAFILFTHGSKAHVLKVR